jgi:hypothetical protein
VVDAVEAEDFLARLFRGVHDAVERQVLLGDQMDARSRSWMKRESP